MTPDVPQDFKKEFDRLIFEIEPITTRMMDILNELPNDSGAKIILPYDGFKVTIEKA